MDEQAASINPCCVGIGRWNQSPTQVVGRTASTWLRRRKILCDGHHSETILKIIDWRNHASRCLVLRRTSDCTPQGWSRRQRGLPRRGQTTYGRPIFPGCRPESCAGRKGGDLECGPRRDSGAKEITTALPRQMNATGCSSRWRRCGIRADERSRDALRGGRGPYFFVGRAVMVTGKTRIEREMATGRGWFLPFVSGWTFWAWGPPGEANAGNGASG